MIRALFNSLLSLLLVVTLLWGGCVSCPQFFMFTTGHKSCCNKAGQCERPTKSAPVKECKRMPLEPQGAASIHAELVVVESAFVFIPKFAALYSETRPAEPSPPDLTVLLSTFLI